jgi:hypothetical protein
MTFAHAQVDITQSTPNLEWREIENKYVKVIYPDYTQKQAMKIASYVEHYAKLVGKSYKISSPDKYTIILRPEGAILNGFVTLAPRRSEFYELNNFTPLFGSSDFLNLLSIHEYRHIIQLDFTNQGYNKYLYYFLGDTGSFLGNFLTTDSWFREGDAVWAETKYTATGRGRSPRFMARLRALLSTGPIPSYDNLLAGDFEKAYPNQYVWGYVLVTSLFNKYGEDIWQDIIKLTTEKFYWPWRFYNAFEEVTGDSFEKFYRQTMQDLQERFKQETPLHKSDSKHKEFTNYYWPQIIGQNTYALKKGLDTYHQLVKISEGSEKVLHSFNLAPNISKPDLRGKYFVYSQLLPHKRFFFKSFSDIFIFNLKTKAHTQFTFDKRYFNLSLSPELKKVAAIGYDEKNNSIVDIIDFQTGEKLKTLQSPSGYYLDLAFSSENELVLISQGEHGKRKTVLYNLNQGQEVGELLEPTLNNIFGLNIDKNRVYFEADFNGRVENFSLDIETKQVSICSNAKIANYQPAISNGKRAYTTELANGRELRVENLNCREVDDKTLTQEFASNYSASDHYQAIEPIAVNKLTPKVSLKQPTKSYSQTKDLVKLNNWSFFGGRGLQLQGDTRNYLGDFTSSATIGKDSEEARNFGLLSLSYAKYYPIFNLTTYYSERNIAYSRGENDEFTEANSSLSATLPYVYKKNLDTIFSSLTLGAGEIHISKRERNKVYELSGDKLNSNFASFEAAWTKDLIFRQIAPSYGVEYQAIASRVEANEEEELDNFSFFQKANIYLPSAFTNHGFKFSVEQERQRDSVFAYRLTTPTASSEYTFSRGYDYEYTGYYEKFSVNYFAPIVYTRLGLSDYAFFYRVHANLFYDTTKIDYLGEEFSLNSSGIEINSDSLLFRKLPLTLSYRLMYLNDKDETQGEIFIGTSL